MSTEPPAAMRARYKKFWNDLTLKGDPARIPNPVWTGYQAGWQAAHPSEEMIEEVARRIAAGHGILEPPFSEEEVAAVLREKLGGGTE